MFNPSNFIISTIDVEATRTQNSYKLWTIRGFASGEGSFQLEIKHGPLFEHEDHDGNGEKHINWTLRVFVDGECFIVEDRGMRKDRHELIRQHEPSTAWMLSQSIDPLGGETPDQEGQIEAELQRIINESDERYMCLDKSWAVWGWVREALRRWGAVQLIVQFQNS